MADWDEDGKLDLLLCFNCQGKLCPTTWLDARVYLLNRTLLPPTPLSLNVDALAEVGSRILSVVAMSRPKRYYRQICDMDVVDFDEDGDLDLFLDLYTRYFERQSTGLIERPQPFGIYNNRVWQVFDFDADGHLELLVNTAPQRVSVPLGFLRRAHDGSFLMSAENPFADINLEHAGWRVYFADWNSDGLPDLFVLTPLHGLHYIDFQPIYYQQTRSRDMAYNSHLTVFENIPYEATKNSDSEIKVLDWNQDGLDDHVFAMDTQGMGVYEVSGLHAQAVPAAWDGLELPNRFVGRSKIHAASLADWDGDGDLDVLLGTYEQPGPGVGQLHYQEREAGHLKPSRPHHQFSAISYQNRRMRFFPIDWDLDGDMDLVLGDGRYFEQLADGSLEEQQQNPFRSVLTSTGGWCQKKCALRFLDCDGDGDLDVLRVQGKSRRIDHPPVQACEHDSIAGTLRCSGDFKCLGTNLSNFLPSHGDDLEKFGRVKALDVVNVSDGLLKFVAFHAKKSGAVLWTAGFCVPLDRCHGKGFCEKGHLNCTCGPGHELGDCSRCKKNFHGVLRNVGQVRERKRCPENDGKVCRGRGECLDDAAAQALAEYTTASMAAGNGSCRCYEARVVCVLQALVEVVAKSSKMQNSLQNASW